jgi:hypothetical protein
MLDITKIYCKDGIHKDPNNCEELDNRFYNHYFYSRELPLKSPMIDGLDITLPELITLF